MADMQFWSAVIPGGGSTTQDIEQTQDTATYLHLTNVALAGDGGNSSHVVSVVVNGKECILATLQRGACMQHQLDMLLDETVTFKNSGPGVVHVGGYITFSSAEDADDDEEDEDEDEDEEAPEGVPLHNGKVDRKMLMKLLGRDNGDDEDDEDEEGEEGEDEDEDEDEEDDGRVKASQRLQAALDAEGDDDFEIDSDDIVGEVEDGEDEDGEDEDGEDEDGEEEDEEGEGEEEDEDEEDEEEEEEEQPKGKAGVKRIPVASTPAPASKKAKVEAARAPASAPPKMQKQQEKQAAAAQKKGGQAPAAGGDVAKVYEKALIDYLAKQPNKTAKMAQLGSSVKRPDGVPKMAAFLQSRANLFKQDVKAGTVMLTK